MGLNRFLVVDGDQGNALFFEMLFKDLGFEPSFATTGHDALEVVKVQHTQMIIVAWELSGMPGTVFIQKARHARNRRYMPCLIYSKRMSESDIKLTKDLGFPDILQMPLKKDEVRTRIQEIIDREDNLDPVESTLRKMDSYILGGKPQEALKLLRDHLFKPGPFLCQVHIMACVIWMAMGKHDKSRENIDQALSIEPDNCKALQTKAKLLSKLGDHEGAINILSELHKSSPANIGTQVKLGSAYIEADRHDEAREVLRGVLDTDPDNQDAKDQSAIIAFKEDDMSLAAQLVAETEAGDEMATIFNSMAIAHISKEEYEAGIVTYKKALKLLSDKARTHLLNYNLGLAYKKMGDLENAFEFFSHAYLTDPSYEKAYSSLAHAAKTLKDKNLKPNKELVAKVKEARNQHKTSNNQAS